MPTVLIRVPGASHEALAKRPLQQAAQTAAILARFGRYPKVQLAVAAAPLAH